MIRQKCRAHIKCVFPPAGGLSVREQMKVITGYQLLERKKRDKQQKRRRGEGEGGECGSLTLVLVIRRHSAVSHSVGPLVIGRGNNRRPETITVKAPDCMEPSRRLTLSAGDTDALTH